MSFDAFNEGARFKSSVWLAQELTGTKLRPMGADGICATNANRTFARLNDVRTDFCRKGRPGKHEEHRIQLARMITKERASRMEGSFGKEKGTLPPQENQGKNQGNGSAVDILRHTHDQCAGNWTEDVRGKEETGGLKTAKHTHFRNLMG